MFTNIDDEICRLGSEKLTRVFRDTLACVQAIELEIVPSEKGRDPKGEFHPAATVGLPWGKPIIQIAESLQDNERREAIAHECGHLLLVYRFGLGMVGRRCLDHGARRRCSFTFPAWGGTGITFSDK